MMGLPLIARVDPDMFDDFGNMIRDKRYDFDDNDYVPPRKVGDDDGPVVGGGSEAGAPSPSKQLPTRVALDAIGLAHRVQTDLEYVCMDFVRHFKERTGETKLCLAGGVALNSVLNGRLSRELGFEDTFIPPYPGDDGIAVGCCAYGLFGGNAGIAKMQDDDDGVIPPASIAPPLWKEPISPYLGPMPTQSSIDEAIEWGSPWLEVDTVADENDRNDLIVSELASGGVVAIYNGRSELGPRALGHRSILADPRKKGLVRFINEFVKKRESFRPFAPSCLSEEASEWFDLGERYGSSDYNVSPYMSITAQVRDDKRELIPAVTHVDGSSRLQTVTSSAEPKYHRLISAFFKATGVPMVLNTSFNTLKGEPIVETPRNAIRSFLSSMGTIELLVMGDYVIKRKDADVRKLLGEERKGGMVTPPSYPRRTGSVNYKTSFSVGDDDEDEDESSGNSKTCVQMPDRPMHNEKDGGWFELLDDMEGQLLGICDGTVGVNEMMTQFTAMSEEENYDKITEADQFLLENIIRRLVRLYEHTFISW
jgi:carbamoyltransferase